MKNYKLRIASTTDFIIISPEILRQLLRVAREAPRRQIKLPADYVVPAGYAEYLLNVLNSNRWKKMFWFSHISEKKLCPVKIYKILEYQMKKLKIGHLECFDHFNLIAESEEKGYSYSMELKPDFFCICQDNDSRFTYIYPDGRQECIVLDREM